MPRSDADWRTCTALRKRNANARRFCSQKGRTTPAKAWVDEILSIIVGADEAGCARRSLI
jgi:hypothetical protein